MKISEIGQERFEDLRCRYFDDYECGRSGCLELEDVLLPDDDSIWQCYVFENGGDECPMIEEWLRREKDNKNIMSAMNLIDKNIKV